MGIFESEAKWFDEIYRCGADPFEIFQAHGISVLGAMRIELFYHGLYRCNAELARRAFDQLTPADKDVIRAEVDSADARPWCELIDALDDPELAEHIHADLCAKPMTPGMAAIFTALESGSATRANQALDRATPQEVAAIFELTESTARADWQRALDRIPPGPDRETLSRRLGLSEA
jgi:hypothetical protein